MFPSRETFVATNSIPPQCCCILGSSVERHVRVQRESEVRGCTPSVSLALSTSRSSHLRPVALPGCPEECLWQLDPSRTQREGYVKEAEM